MREALERIGVTLTNGGEPGVITEEKTRKWDRTIPPRMMC
jgi:hypothetical protein